MQITTCECLIASPIRVQIIKFTMKDDQLKEMSKRLEMRSKVEKRSKFQGLEALHKFTVLLIHSNY